MKKTLLIIVFSVCGCLLAGADLQAGTVGAGGTAGSREVFTIGEAAVGLKTGLVPVWRALLSGNPSINNISINSVIHNVHENKSRFSVYALAAGTVQIRIAGQIITAEAVTTAPATIELSASVSQDLYKNTVTAHLGTSCASSAPKIYVQDLLLARQGQTPTAANLKVYCGVGVSTTINCIINNMGNSAATLVLTSTATGTTGWKVIYKDGTTDVTSQVEGSGYEITLSAAQKYSNFSIVLFPMDKTAGALQLNLSAHTKNYPLNIVTRAISAQAGVEPNVVSAGSSAAGYNQDTGKTSLYFVVNPQTSGAAVSGSSETMAKLYIFNLAGKLVHQQDIAIVNGYNLVDIQAALGRGVFIYQIVRDGNIIGQGRYNNR